MDATKFALFAAIAILAPCGCGNDKGTAIPEETLDFSAYESKTFEEMPTNLSNRFVEVKLQQDSSDFILSYVNKAVNRCNKLYVLDEGEGKICVFKESGEGDFVLSRVGRGPQEYLQITDFDVDKDGDI